jgi:myo-inositol-1(or 4)-monophosphatase
VKALQERFETAVALASEAGELAMRMRRGTTAMLKGPQDWVTEADRVVERFLSERLAAAFPADGFQGEENGIARRGTLCWVVDPIDGTANYMRGGRRFCVSLACLEDRTPLIGAIMAPAVSELYVARRGGGALLNGGPIRVADTSSLDRAIIEIGWSRRRANRDFLALCEKLLDHGAVLRQGGSGALGLVEVAAGRLDGYVELHINLWDVAAALVILAESGAALNAFLGGDGLISGNPIQASTPGLAEALSAVTGLPSSAIPS